MTRSCGFSSVLGVTLLVFFSPSTAVIGAAFDDTSEADQEARVSFLNDVAPILVENCVGCHNPRKSESRYDLTTFEQLEKGGAMGEGIMLEPGDPDLSYFVELLRPDGIPLMPYDQDPLPESQRAIIEQWVLQGAEYDGEDAGENWVALLNRSRTVEIPETYPIPMPITALAFQPEGKHVLTSGYHEINAYDLDEANLHSRTPGTAERLYDIALSPDGRYVATASGDPGQLGSAKLWTIDEEGKIEPLFDLLETDDTLFAVAFSPDSKRIATAGADRAISIFDVESGDRLGLIEDHADWIFDIAFSPDGTRIASASRDKTSKLFDAETYESIVTFPGHGETVYTVDFVQDGKLVASGGDDNQIRIWNPEQDARQVRAIGGFGGPVFKLQALPEHDQIAACGADKTVRIFEAASGKAVKSLEGHRDWIYALSVAPDGQSLATGSWDGEVRVWNLDSGELIHSFLAAPGHEVGETPDLEQAAAR